MTREEALEAALRTLLVRHRDEADDGEEECQWCAVAQEALAMSKKEPVGWLDCRIPHHIGRLEADARLLRVAEAVAEVQAQRATDYVNGVLGTDFLAGFGEHMRTTIDLAKVVEGVK